MSSKGGVLSLNETKFILESLSNGIRVDGRGPLDFRSIELKFGRQENGEVNVLLGQTRVHAFIDAEITTPFEDRPTEGFFSFHVMIDPMASQDSLFMNRTKSSVAKETTVELGRIVERGLRESHAIDSESLCIVANQKVWKIDVTVHVLDDGGNALDCCSIAAISSLLHFRKPNLLTSDAGEAQKSRHFRGSVPLSIHHIPISISFALFQGNEIVIDPSFKEEQMMDGRLTITLNPQNQVCAVQKIGGLPLSAETILEYTHVAARKVKEIVQIIQTACQKFEQLKEKRQKKESNELHLNFQGDDPLIPQTSISPSTPQGVEVNVFGGGKSAWDDEDDLEVNEMGTTNDEKDEDEGSEQNGGGEDQSENSEEEGVAVLEGDHLLSSAMEIDQGETPQKSEGEGKQKKKKRKVRKGDLTLLDAVKKPKL